MKKKTTKMRGMRLSEATYKAVVQAAKARDYASPSAFIYDEMTGALVAASGATSPDDISACFGSFKCIGFRVHLLGGELPTAHSSEFERARRKLHPRRAALGLGP